jgi:hypothetical protein
MRFNIAFSAFLWVTTSSSFGDAAEIRLPVRVRFAVVTVVYVLVFLSCFCLSLVVGPFVMPNRGR